MIKAALFDIDGTLVGPGDAGVPRSAWRAIEALRERGVKVIIATGRSTYEIQPELRCGFDAYVTANGQICYDGDGVFRDVPIDPADVRVIVEQARAGRYDVLVQMRDRAFVSRLSERVRRACDLVGLDYAVGDLEEALEGPVYQFNAFVDVADEAMFLSETSGVRTTRWTNLFCDVVPVDGGKHLGIRALLDRLGIASEEAIAFGDGENDLTMFAEVGASVAMGNAWDGVKERATYVTSDVEDDGIWNACRGLGLV